MAGRAPYNWPSVDQFLKDHNSTAQELNIAGFCELYDHAFTTDFYEPDDNDEQIRRLRNFYNALKRRYDIRPSKSFNASAFVRECLMYQRGYKGRQDGTSHHDTAPIDDGQNAPLPAIVQSVEVGATQTFPSQDNNMSSSSRGLNPNAMEITNGTAIRNTPAAIHDLQDAKLHLEEHNFRVRNASSPFQSRASLHDDKELANNKKDFELHMRAIRQEFEQTKNSIEAALNDRAEEAFQKAESLIKQEATLAARERDLQRAVDEFNKNAQGRDRDLSAKEADVQERERTIAVKNNDLRARMQDEMNNREEAVQHVEKEVQLSKKALRDREDAVKTREDATQQRENTLKTAEIEKKKNETLIANLTAQSANLRTQNTDLRNQNADHGKTIALLEEEIAMHKKAAGTHSYHAKSPALVTDAEDIPEFLTPAVKTFLDSIFTAAAVSTSSDNADDWSIKLEAFNDTCKQNVELMLQETGLDLKSILDDVAADVVDKGDLVGALATLRVLVGGLVGCLPDDGELDME